jgi:hypothetical protein
VCGDEGGRLNRIFRLDGTYTGVSYGDPQFEFNQEGINLYDTGGGQGYLLVSDQYTDGQPNEFEVFDRVTLAALGNFESPSGAIVTRNTDGATLEQRPFPGFPNGAFFAVNDDENAHCYDWTDIAQAMGLEIAALERPFEVEAPPSALPTRRAIWFHDGSWWAAIRARSGLSISRFEDGNFAAMTEIGPDVDAVALAAGEDLVLLMAAEEPSLRRYRYEPALRRYRATGQELAIQGASGPFVDLSLEGPPEGPLSRALAAWVAGGEARVGWSAAGISAWEPSSLSLGAASAASPRLVRLQGATGLFWASPDGFSFSYHADADPPEAWSPPEAIAGPEPTAVYAVMAPGGEVLACAAAPDGSGTLWSRAPDGTWSSAALSGQVRDPAMIVDGARSKVHLFHAVEISGHRVIQHREAGVADLAFGAPALAAGWPAVDQEALLCPSEIPAEAGDLVLASLGNDGLGQPCRIAIPVTPDSLPPITLQHSPPPGTSGIRQGSTLSFRLTDDRAGVDVSKLEILVGGVTVTPTVRGVPRNLLVTCRLPSGTGPTVAVTIRASDLAAPPHPMAPFEYELTLEPPEAPSFRRADANQDGEIDVSDAIKVLFVLFVDGVSAGCADALDANDDRQVDITDAIHLLGYLFLAGEDIPPPSLECGTDPTDDALGCEIPPICR